MRIPLVRSGADRTPIAAWEYLFTPVLLVVLFVVGFPLAAASVPYFWLYPDRHCHQWEHDGNPSHARLLGRWRAMYRRLSLAGRIRRACIRSWRRRRAA
jgi:hypothetical protein